MTCKDCLHFIVCEKACLLFNEQTVEERCKHFKNKADFVEVVKCKDCHNRYEKNWSKCTGRRPDDFCSDGKRKEGD